MRQIIFSSLVFLSLLQIFLPSSTVLGQQQHQVQWGQVQPFRVPSQFAPLQNSQGNGLSGQQKLAQRMSDQTQSKTGSLSNGPVLGGKIHLLSTLWKGMRNSGLERSIAGDVLERVLKISLRDLLVPFKRDVLFPLMS